MTLSSKIRKEVYRKAKALLNRNYSRQDANAELCNEYHDNRLVAGVLKYMPTRAAKKKYGFYNYLLIAILLLFAVLISYYQPMRSSMIWLTYIYLAVPVYVVFRYLTEYYTWLTFYGLVFLIVFVTLGLMHPDEPFSLSKLVVVFLFCAPVILLPMWLQGKLCPSPKMHLESYTDDKGVAVRRLVYEFPD